MNDTLKINHPPRELVDEHSTSPDRQENASPLHIHRRQTSCPKAISLPSSPHKYRSRDHGSESNEAEKLEANLEMIATWNKLLESSSFGNEPWFPYHEWNIDYSELTVGSRVGIGFFGEVFKGTWNGIDVAIKVLLEQEVTAENIEDFCNEISILRYHSLIGRYDHHSEFAVGIDMSVLVEGLLASTGWDELVYVWQHGTDPRAN